MMFDDILDEKMHSRLYNCHYNAAEKIAFLLTHFSPKFLLNFFFFSEFVFLTKRPRYDGKEVFLP